MPEFMITVLFAFLVVGCLVAVAQVNAKNARARLKADAHPDAGITDDDTIPEMRAKTRAYLIASDMATLLERIIMQDDMVTTLDPKSRKMADDLLARYHTHTKS